MMQSSLAEKLRILRARRGLTVRDAAQKIGVDRHTLHRLEGGVGEPRYPTLHKIAKGYGVPIEGLLIEEEPALAGKAEASETGPSLLESALDAARTDEEKDSQAMARLRASEGVPQSVSEYEEKQEDELHVVVSGVHIATDEWAKAMSDPNMDSMKRYGLMDAAGTLFEAIDEEMRGRGWHQLPPEQVPQKEYWEGIGSLVNIFKGIKAGIRVEDAKGTEEEFEQRREQIREWTRRIERMRVAGE